MDRIDPAQESPAGAPPGALACLCDIPLGQPVELVEIALPLAEAEPLFERGLLPGTVIRNVRRSPSGDPIVRVHGTTLALRRETAEGLRVRPLATGS